MAALCGPSAAQNMLPRNIPAQTTPAAAAFVPNAVRVEIALSGLQDWQAWRSAFARTDNPRVEVLAVSRDGALVTVSGDAPRAQWPQALARAGIVWVEGPVPAMRLAQPAAGR